jgi:glycosyltransferase involved in cell wall biosynthesis
MNILITSWRDIKNPLSGGAEVFTHELAKNLVAKGHAVTLIAPMFPGSKSQEKIEGVRILRPVSFFPTSGVSYLRLPILVNRITREVEKQANFIDVIINQIHGIPLVLTKISSKPTLFFPLEVAGNIWNYEIPFPGNVFGKLLESIFLRKYQNHPFMVISKSVADELKSYGIKNISIINPGINSPKIINAKKSENPYFISLGRITPMKRLEDTLSAFSLFYQKNQNAELHIVGRGKPAYQGKFKKLSCSLNLSKVIHFHGFIEEEEKYRQLAKSWALLSTSFKEGFGLNVLEAASVGTPALAYQVSGIVDAVKNGETGLLTKKNTPEELAKLMKRISDNRKLRTKLSLTAKNHSKKFSWKKTADQFLQALSSIIRGPTPKS